MRQMPRFYFDIREGNRFVADKEGLELADLQEAEKEAGVTSTEIARDRLPLADCRSISIEVRAQDGERVLTVTVTMVVDRGVPAP